MGNKIGKIESPLAFVLKYFYKLWPLLVKEDLGYHQELVVRFCEPEWPKFGVCWLPRALLTH